ncbi:MAG: ABC transporter ATP-binding protein [Alphaproteobacteria bacterium]|nr:ABC transporter ATP-binding protein [Alphaproteobacteria bacterium]
MSDTLLELKNVSAGYGEVKVLKGVSLKVRRGSITALIGANGAGKTTLMRVVSGLIPVTQGTLALDAVDITREASSVRVERGISLIPEGRLIFPDFSVEENLKIGGYISRVRSRQSELIKQMYRFFPRLEERRNQAGETLSGGEQQMLAIARGLMADPRLLLLDEPSLGLAPQVVAQVFEKIQEVRSKGVTVFIVEQDVRSTLAFADYAYVLENGELQLEGPAADVRENPKVKESYLGL